MKAYWYEDKDGNLGVSTEIIPGTKILKVISSSKKVIETILERWDIYFMNNDSIMDCIDILDEEYKESKDDEILKVVSQLCNKI